MIAFFVFIVVLALPPLFLFVRTKPVTDRVDALRRANALAWFATLFAGSIAWIYASRAGGSPMLAIIAGVAMGGTVLMLAALLRFFAFRKPRAGG
jgi:apolipoprotein N-acyltransferase